MYYHNIDHCNLINGEGLRVCIWCSGCHFHCKGCFNSETWDFKSGIPFDDNAENELFEALAKDYIQGLTFLGGSPLAPENIEEITLLAKRAKKEYPTKDIWLYTGYTWDKVKHLDIMQYIDVLCEGRFIEELKDENYPYLGSLNQNLINVPKSLKYKRKIILDIQKEYLNGKKIDE